MSRYINAERIHPALFNIYKAATSRIARKTIEKCDYELSLIPAADVAPIVHAHFVKNKDLHTAFCSVCTFSIRNHTEGIENIINYCPNCGARMDEEAKP